MLGMQNGVVGVELLCCSVSGWMGGRSLAVSHQ